MRMAIHIAPQRRCTDEDMRIHVQEYREACGLESYEDCLKLVV